MDDFEHQKYFFPCEEGENNRNLKLANVIDWSSLEFITVSWGAEPALYL